jgi:hypothetical protein
MLSTKYRLKLEYICKLITESQEVQLADMIWAEKLSKANTSARNMLESARRKALKKNNPLVDRGLDEFLCDMGLGDPDPSNHVRGFDSVDEIASWFKQERSDDWRQRD